MREVDAPFSGPMSTASNEVSLRQTNGSADRAPSRTIRAVFLAPASGSERWNALSQGRQSDALLIWSRPTFRLAWSDVCFREAVDSLKKLTAIQHLAQAIFSIM